MRQLLGLSIVLALVGCSADAPTDPSAATSSSDQISERVGPRGFELGTSIDALAAPSSLTIDARCLVVRLDGARIYVAASAERPRSFSLADFQSAPNRIIRAEFLDRETFFDTGCTTVASDPDGAPAALTQTDAAELLAPGPTEQWDSQTSIIRSYAVGQPGRAVLNEGGSIPFAGTYDLDGDTIPITVRISNRGVSAVRLTLGALTEAKLDEARASLNERYSLVWPSDAQISDFIAQRTNCLGYASADTRVALIVQRSQRNPDGIMFVSYATDHRDREEIARCLPAGVMPPSRSGGL
jgi:hypothetical protein